MGVKGYVTRRCDQRSGDRGAPPLGHMPEPSRPGTEPPQHMLDPQELKPKLPEIYYVPPHLAVPFTEEEIAAYIEVGLAIILQRCPPPTTRHPPPR